MTGWLFVSLAAWWSALLLTCYAWSRHSRFRAVEAFGKGILVGRSLARFSEDQVNAIIEGTGVHLDRRDTDGAPAAE